MIKFVSAKKYETLKQELQEALEQCESLQLYCEKERNTNSLLENEVASLKAEIEKVRKGAEASGREMLGIRKKYDALKKEFDTYRTNSMSRHEAEKEVREIKKMLRGVEDLKAHYELRIKHLRHALADARAMLADRESYNAAKEIGVIDLHDKPSAREQRPSVAPASTFNSDESPANTDSSGGQWFEPLPE